MDLRESPELGEFRKEVREWVLANLPEPPNPLQHRGLEDDDYVTTWFSALAKKKWLAFRWPEQFGGAGFTESQQLIFVDELMRCGAPVPRGFGISMVGPLIYQFGTDWQKERFLPRIAAHDEIWCQGYSEPNSGSDLASLQTRAEMQDDDHFLVNGQKTWTSRADAASWIFALVRTDSGGKKQEGISFLLIDMSTPGVSIKPIKQINGKEGFFETFFDNVKVPVKNIVGETNKGWTMAKALLGHERVMTGANVDMNRLIDSLKAIATQYERSGAPVLKDATYRDRIAQMEMDADCLRYTRYRMNTAVMRGQAPGPESSIFKVYQAELCQRLYDWGMDAMGIDSTRWYDDTLSEEAFDIPMSMTITRAMSIYSGSNEVQRNIISKRVLGLPD